MKRYLKNLFGVNALARHLKAAMKKWDLRKLHRQLSAVQQTHDLAVVIIMPGSVHIGALALNYLRENKQVLCISNGLLEWEYEILLGCPFTAVAKTSRTLTHSLRLAPDRGLGHDVSALVDEFPIRWDAPFREREPIGIVDEKKAARL